MHCLKDQEGDKDKTASAKVKLIYVGTDLGKRGVCVLMSRQFT